MRRSAWRSQALPDAVSVVPGRNRARRTQRHGRACSETGTIAEHSVKRHRISLSSPGAGREGERSNLAKPSVTGRLYRSRNAFAHGCPVELGSARCPFLFLWRPCRGVFLLRLHSAARTGPIDAINGMRTPTVAESFFGGFEAATLFSCFDAFSRRKRQAASIGSAIR